MKFNNKVIITGYGGQDSVFLAGQLLKDGWEVIGSVRPGKSETLSYFTHDNPMLSRVRIVEADLTNESDVKQLVYDIRPALLFHLAAYSVVGVGDADNPEIVDINFLSTLYLLSSIEKFSRETRFFFAASSELFGNSEVSPQDENTPFNPRNLYGITKLSSYHLVKTFRDRKGVFASNGILYNHESPYRDSRFVTGKIVSSAVNIKKGNQKEISLGDINARRDWGYAGDFTRAMRLILDLPKADDFIVATGKLHTVKEVLELSFGYLGLDYHDYLKVDDSLMRQEKGAPLCGDSGKLKRLSGWEPQYTFRQVIEDMISYRWSRADNEYI